MLGKSWRGGPCIYWTSSPCRRSTDSATTDVRSARQHPKCPETSQRCSRNVSFYKWFDRAAEYLEADPVDLNSIGADDALGRSDCPRLPRGGASDLDR